MKKVFLSFLAIVLLSFVLSAQQFGVMLGGGLSQKTVPGISNETKDPLFTLNGYVFTDIELGKKKAFSILPALGYTSKGIVYRKLGLFDILGNQFAVSDYKSRISYLQIDIPVCYKLGLSKSGQVFIGAGPYLAYAVTGKTRYFNNSDSFEGTPMAEPAKIDFKNENISRFDAGLVFRATAVFSKRFSAGLKWDVGLTNLYRAQVQGDSHNRMLGLNIGYLFNKK